MKYPRYPKYKDSGVEWIGEVPEHWEIKQLKRGFKIVNGSTPRSDEENFWDGDINWATPEDLSSNEGHVLGKTNRRISREGYDSCGTTLVPRGSLILSTRAPIGYVKITGSELCTNQGCRSLVKVHTGVNQLYQYYFLLISEPVLNSRGQGSTFTELSKESLSSFKTLWPTPEEQDSIASFLNKITSKMDGLITKQQQMIELLKEKRQAIINHAVTKGLDPNGQLRDSGIEFTGEINRSWTLTKIIYYSKIRTGGTPNREIRDFWENGTINWMSSGEINKEYIYEVKEKITERGYKNSNANILPINTIMIALNGQGKTKGSVGILKIESTCNQSLAGFITDEDKLHHRYLFYFLKSRYKKLRGLVGDDIRDGLSLTALRGLRIPIPSVKEQIQISDYLDDGISKIALSIEKQQQMIELLREHKSTLITQAVTGKIDVRGLVQGVNDSARQTP